MIIDSPIISGSLASTGSLNQIGNVVITGSLTVTGPISGNITGSADSASFATTASYALSASHVEFADDAISASYAVSASHAERVDDAISSSYAVSSSYSLSGSYSFGATSASYAASATSSSYALNTTTASYAISASHSERTDDATSASYALSSSYAFGATSASYTVSSSHSERADDATSASYAVSSSYSLSGSYAFGATSASYALSSSYAMSSSYALTSSYALSSSYAANADLLDGRDSLTYANTGSNTFTNTQYINAANNAVSFTSTASLYTDGGVRVTKDMYVSGTAYFNNVTVYGTQSINYISSSQLNIGTNIISVNTDTPSIRFGGLAVYDSGSTGLTGSILWDSEDNQWIYSNPSGAAYDSAVFLVGPISTGPLGNEVGINCNFLSKGNGLHHMTSSGIFEDGSRTCFYGSSIITSTGVGCFSGAVCSPTFVGGTVSGTTIYGSTAICGAVICGGATTLTGTLTGTSATFSSTVSIGGADQGYNLDVKKTSTGDSTFDTIANFYKTSTNNTQLLIRAKNGLIDLAGSYVVGGGGPNTGLSFSVSPAGGSPTTAFTIASTGIACFACQVCAPNAVISNCLGVGVAVPQGNFEVAGLSYFTRASNSLLINPNYGGANTHVQLQVVCNMALAFATNGDNERMRISSGGITCFSNAVCAPFFSAGDGTQCNADDAPLTIKRGVGFAGLDFKSLRTTGNIGGARFHDCAGTVQAQLLVEVDGSYNFYNATANNRLKITSTGIACFACQVCVTGNADTAAGLVINNGSGASGTCQHYINFTAGATTIARMFRGNGVSGLAGGGITIDNYDGMNIRLNQLGGSGGVLGITGGNVGIGTASAASSANYTSLVINGTTGSELYLRGAGVDYGYMYANSGVVVLATQTAIPLTFQTNTNERLRITSTGISCFACQVCAPNVSIVNCLGVGTAPGAGYILDVYQPASSTTAYARIKNNRTRNAALQLETNCGNYLVGVGIGTDTNRLMIYDNNAEATRLTLDQCGNVGLGTTPAAWVSTARAFQINAYNSIASQHNGSFNIISEAYESAANNFAYGSTGGYPTRINMNPNDGVISIFNAPTGTAGNTITWCERMRITSVGCVGIGTEFPNGLLHIQQCRGGEVGFRITNSQGAAGNTSATVAINMTLQNGSAGNSGVIQLIAGKESDHQSAANVDDYFAITTTSNDVTTERMRITSTGIACFACQVCAPSAIFGGSAVAKEFTVNKGASDSIGAGAYVFYSNTDSSRGAVHQLNAAFGLDTYTFNGTTWSRRITLSNDGIACFSNTICAGARVSVVNSGVDATFQDAFVGVYSGNNNEQNAIQTSVSSNAANSGFLFMVSCGAGLSTRSCGYKMVRNGHTFYVANSAVIAIDSSGNLYPSNNGTQDLGSSSNRWCTVYTSDLSLNNGIGNYTIVEGENDLFLYNNNSCKVYKFIVQEVCPEIAPAKRST